MTNLARRHGWLIALAMVLLMTQVCAAATTPAGKKELIVATGGDIQKLDPHMSTNVIDLTVHFNIFDKLVKRGQDFKLQPGLATEWKRINDTTW
ncbi:MAG TPA: hypothetical protein VLM91_01935, partial [Candidatus Methylomirabilis sp.]|nr:hypothetical protein [Candidatus Methylomirabilis sp.]